MKLVNHLLKKFLSVTLAVAIVAGLSFTVGCEKGQNASTSLKGINFFGTPSGLHGKPWENDPTATFVQLPETELTSDKFEAPEDGTLLVSMTFDDLSEKGARNVGSAMDELGIYVDKAENGALCTMRAHVDIKDEDGDGDNEFKITGFDGETNYGHGFLVLVPSNVFGAYSEHSFTYQYDVKYRDAYSPTGYFAVCTDYSSYNFDYFGIRNSGIGLSQRRVNASNYNHDIKGAYYSPDTGKSSIISEILGIQYDKDADSLSEISLSVRGVIDRENGSSYYVRVNDPGYPGSNVWMLVSKDDKDSAAAKNAKDAQMGGAIALTMNNSQNGTFDNFIVWVGTGEQPSDLSSPLLKDVPDKCTAHRYVGSGETCLDAPTCIYCGHKASSPKHNFVEIPEATDAICTDCGCFYSSLTDISWPVPEIPIYRDGGTVSSTAYNMGQVPDNQDWFPENDSKCILVEFATQEMLKMYAKRLEAYGFTQTYANSLEDNVYYQYQLNGKSMYIYFNSGDGGEIRIIYDPYSDIKPQDLNYKAESGKVDDTEFYMYGIRESVETGGMMFIVKLCDNSLIIIDGYTATAVADKRLEDCMSFMRELTGTKDGEKIRVAAWVNTHAHADHYRGFESLAATYPDTFFVERVLTNYGSPHCQTAIYVDYASAYRRIAKFLASVTDENTQFIKVHDGEQFSFAGVGITVLYTQDDLLNTTAPSTVSSDFNSTSVTYQFDVNGAKFLMLGDMTTTAATIISRNLTEKTLKSDVVQTAHHLFNNVDSVYAAAQAEYVFVTQGEIFGKTAYPHTLSNLNSASAFTTEDKVFFEGNGTYGLKVAKRGKVKLFRVRELVEE